MKENKYDISVEWTGGYPALCHGYWIIAINGKTLQGLGTDHMNTLGNYSIWSFDDDWHEVWERYDDGEDWCNSGNLPNNLGMALRLAGFDPKDKELLQELYIKVQEEDWRSSSCGGCI